MLAEECAGLLSLKKLADFVWFPPCCFSNELYHQLLVDGVGFKERKSEPD